MEDLPVQERPLHEYDLDFPLDDLSSLPSIYLALVRFHPNASEYDKDRATILFLQRRTDWMIQERERIRKEEEELRNRQDVKPRVDVNEEEEGDEPIAIEVRKPHREEIVIDDTDEEEIVVVGRVDKGKGKAKEQERRSKKRKSVAPSPPADTRPAKRVSSVTKQASSSRTSTSTTTTSPRKRPPGFANPIPKLPSFKRLGAGPSSVVPTTILLPSTHERDQPLPDPLPERNVPGPVFVPNPIATRAHNLPSFLAREDTAQDSNGRFAFRPPPPGPFFPPVPPSALEASKRDAPPELVKQLTTIGYPALDKRITCHLLFLFLSRNQPKLAPRPIAMRKTEYGIFVAFKSKQDAEQMKEMSLHKVLPNLDNLDGDSEYDNDEYEEYTYEGRILNPWLFDEETILTMHCGQVSKESIAETFEGWKDGTLDWKWGELSDEVRRDWKKHERLPRARVMPRRDVPEGTFISEEYQEEVEILNDPYDCATAWGRVERESRSIKKTRERRRRLDKIKAELYVQRCEALDAWYLENPGIEDYSTRPSFPALPSDESCIPKLEAVEEEANRRKATDVAPVQLGALEVTHERLARFKEAFDLRRDLGTEENEDWEEAFCLFHHGLTVEGAIAATEQRIEREERDKLLRDMLEELAAAREREKEREADRRARAEAEELLARRCAATKEAARAAAITVTVKATVQNEAAAQGGPPSSITESGIRTCSVDPRHRTTTIPVVKSGPSHLPSNDLNASIPARHVSGSNSGSDGRLVALADLSKFGLSVRSQAWANK
ncbi:hypothetical protein JCM16303_000455 [Sporobolomyces ruberrimus]